MEEKSIDYTKCGYKIVDADLCGRNGLQYEVGKTQKIKGPLKVGANGLHFCDVAAHCYASVIEFKRPLRYLRVLPQGELREEFSHSGINTATLSLLIVGEMTGDQWMERVHREFDGRKASAGQLALAAADQNNSPAMKAAMRADASINMTLIATAALAGSARVLRQMAHETPHCVLQSTTEWCARLGSIQALETLQTCFALNYTNAFTWAALGESEPLVNWISRRIEWRAVAETSLHDVLMLAIPGKLTNVVSMLATLVSVYGTPRLIKHAVEYAIEGNKTEILAILEAIVLRGPAIKRISAV